MYTVFIEWSVYSVCMVVSVHCAYRVVCVQYVYGGLHYRVYRVVCVHCVHCVYGVCAQCIWWSVYNVFLEWSVYSVYGLCNLA